MFLTPPKQPLSGRGARAAAGWYWRLTERADAAGASQDHQVAAQLRVYGVALVQPQSLQHGKGKDRYAEQDSPGLGRAAKRGDADDSQDQAGEGEPGPPVRPEGAREVKVLEVQSHAHDRLRSSGRIRLSPSVHPNLDRPHSGVY
jgi:hypothetical protein